MDHTTLTFISLSFLVIVIILVYLLRFVHGLQKKNSEEATRAATEVGFVVDTFHDLVTKLKDKERELEILRSMAEDRASAIEIYNEDILQSVPSGVVSLDQGLTITRMNASAEKILDLTEASVVGKGQKEVFSSPIRELIAGQQDVIRTEAAHVTGSGKRIWLGLNISPLKDSAGAIIGKILVFTDLTELKAFQSQMELRERLSNLGEMSAGIAHELRNPMGVISGYTKILSRKCDASLLPAVEAIAKEVSVMDRIITDFLSFARPSDLVLAAVDLVELVEGCICSLEPNMDGITIVRDLQDRPLIRADEVLLRQSVNNLIRNAVEAMPEGGVLRVGVGMGEHIELMVADTGHGIPANVKDKIFLPFYTTKERGTGLGLSIVHKVIVSHGWSLKVDTGEQGTVFTITLPGSSIVPA